MVVENISINRKKSHLEFSRPSKILQCQNLKRYKHFLDILQHEKNPFVVGDAG